MDKFYALNPAIQRTILGAGISIIPSVSSESYTICISTALTLGLTGIADSVFKLNKNLIYAEGVAALAIGALVNKYLDGQHNMLFDALATLGVVVAADMAQKWIQPKWDPSQPHKWAYTKEFTDEKGRHVTQVDNHGDEYHREDIKDGSITTSGYVVDDIWAIKTGVTPDTDGKYSHTSKFGVFPSAVPDEPSRPPDDAPRASAGSDEPRPSTSYILI